MIDYRDYLSKKGSLTGFTLIELLIASVIFFAILLSVYSAFYAGLMSYNKMDSSFNTYQEARVIFNRMERDLKNSFAYSNADSGFRGESQALEFFTAIDSYNNAQPEINLYHMKYMLTPDSLERSFHKGIEALNPASEGSRDALTSNIKELVFQYAYPADNSGNSYNWQASWPKENDDNQKKALPLAVKVKLALIQKDSSEGRDKGEVSVDFYKVIPLPLSGRI